jgi:hypothetical protein
MVPTRAKYSSVKAFAPAKFLERHHRLPALQDEKDSQRYDATYRAPTTSGSPDPDREDTAATTHWASTAVAPIASCIAGSATGTAVSSINAMLEARTIAARTHGAASEVHGALAISDRTIPSLQGCLITFANF